MRNIYTEINQIMFPAVKGRGVCQQKIPLIPIATFPARNATYAYTTSSTNILEIRNHLHIATNLRSSQIQERTKRLTETQSGWKEIHDVYFFFHEQQLYIIAPRCKEGTDPAVGYRRASKEFWKNYLPDQQPITKL
ncbi:MAG: hypothetical protein LBU27_04280 [Candidatus Peribacteria bacterium]|jgi:hypothetical protein|nr:hypothetical protein [Candidatus Peribacteria bacterium]